MKSEYPKTHLMNPAFQYVNSNQTDIKKTFERIRKEMERKPPKVITMRKK